MGVCYGTPYFPTPSNAGSFKSGMKLTISDSSSAASHSYDFLADPYLTVFSFAELKEATKNFRGDALLGEGEFGYVYKGMLHRKQQSGRRKARIVVYRLNRDACQRYRGWLMEIEFFRKLSHPNLAKLLGYCREDENLALVYEFMPNGSLNNHLYRKGSTAHLPWDIRLKIAVGAARGLAFLHTSERKIIYRGFKTSNILLDGSYRAKLTDFGLVKSGPPEGKSHVSAEIIGTIGYAAPEYSRTGHLYVKSDVYSFGVVLLEILTGLSAFDGSRPVGKRLLVEWARPLLSSERNLKTLVDSRLSDNYSMDSAFQIAQLALKCLQGTTYERPSMKEVIEELESIEAASDHRIPRDV